MTCLSLSVPICQLGIISLLNVTRIKVRNEGDRVGASEGISSVNMHLISLPLQLTLSFTEHSASLNPFLCPLSSASLSISFLFNNNNEEQERNYEGHKEKEEKEEENKKGRSSIC